MNIDWSKAPEGTTGAMVAQFEFPLHGKGHTEWIPSQGKRQEYAEGKETWIYFPRPFHEQWNGLGLPPVGAVCECKVTHGAAWVKCEVVAHKDHYAIAYVDENTVMLSAGIRFRPIRTPEEMAADEREAAINGMLCYDALGNSRRGLAESLYDAGFRKQEAP